MHAVDTGAAGHAIRCIPGTTAAHQSRLHASTLCNAFAVMPYQLCTRVAILVTSAVFYVTRNWINISVKY